MRDYYSHCPLEKRPKIFGMTASPIWNIDDAAESLRQLEQNLLAKVIAVREHMQELDGHAPKPREVSLSVLPLPYVLISSNRKYASTPVAQKRTHSTHPLLLASSRRRS